MAKIKTIAWALAGFSTLSSAAHAATPNQTGMAMMRLNAALLESGSKPFASGSLWTALRRDFRMAEVNPELVRRHENSFVKGSAYFDRTINRSKPYMYHIANEVKKRNMPSEIALLPFIESAYVTKARSHVGASGLWQFMPATGRHYGLERTPLYDGRHDVYAATDAALNYLEYLHGLFGDWSLALAAYNWGEGNVGRAINRARAQGLEPTYENLRMPNETRNYVPKLLAVRNLVNQPQSFGINLSEIDNKPHFKTLSLDQPADISAIARLAGISESEFLTLNPGFNAPVFIPKHNRKLLLPVAAAATFERNYRNASAESLLSWDVYTPFSSTSLSSVAAQTGMSVAEIKRLNGMSANSISAGRSILVAKNSLNGNRFGQESMNFVRLDTDTTPDTYRSNMPVLQTASAAPVAAVTRTVEPVAVAATPSPRLTSAIPSSNSQMPTLVATETIAISEPLPLPTRAETAPVAATATVTAFNEPLPLPIQPVSEPAADTLAATAVADSDDPLLALAQASALRLNAADSVRNTIAQAQADEAAAQARAAQLAEARAKQQQRTEARLARAARQTQTAAANTHRVAAGDTLYNIAQRYNLSVADLITANNIKGNNIRAGQVLNVAAVAKRNAVRNVSYTVRKGDTLNTIASRFNVDVNDIRRWNRNTRTIVPGQRLNLQGS